MNAKGGEGRLLLADFYAKNSNILRSRSLEASHGDFRGFFYKATVKSMLLARWQKRNGTKRLLLRFKPRINL
jgi:hypothetical protein